MAVTVDPGLVAAMAATSGHVTVELRDASDPDAARRGMEAARSALFRIPHPEEPDDPLPSFVSEVQEGPNGPTIGFDVADAEGYEGLLERVASDMAAAIEAAGGEGVLAGTASPPYSETSGAVQQHRRPAEAAARPRQGIRTLELDVDGADLVFHAELNREGDGEWGFMLVSDSANRTFFAESRRGILQCRLAVAGPSHHPEERLIITSIEGITWSGRVPLGTLQIDGPVVVDIHSPLKQEWDPNAGPVTVNAASVPPEAPIRLPAGARLAWATTRLESTLLQYAVEDSTVRAVEAFVTTSARAAGFEVAGAQAFQDAPGHLRLHGRDLFFDRPAGEKLAIRIYGWFNTYDDTTSSSIALHLWSYRARK